MNEIIMYNYAASIALTCLFIAMEWPLSIIYTTILTANFITLVVAAYRAYNNPTIILTLVSFYHNVVSELKIIANKLNRSVSITELTGMRLINVMEGDQVHRYYIPIHTPVKHQVLAMSSTYEDITAAEGCEYDVTPRQLGCDHFKVTVGESTFTISSEEKLLLKNIIDRESEDLYVD